jgi:hypothetical protein
MAEKIQINLFDEQFLQAPRNWQKCSALDCPGKRLSVGTDDSGAGHIFISKDISFRGPNTVIDIEGFVVKMPK